MHKNTLNTSAAPSSSTSNTPTITEYSIRVPKNMKNKHHVMRFNYNLNIDFTNWKNVRMERENNKKDFHAMEEDMPKFGAGSEYNRDQKEEARRKKFGIIAKKYNPEAQPWILKVGSGKAGKKFKGIREGGVSENAAHFVFTQTKDGSIEAFPLNEWYNFQPIQRYKALTAEEAEEEFGRRKKCVNMWTMKMRMKLKNKDDEEPEDPEDKPIKGAKSDKKNLQISEMDEWMDSDDDSSSNESGDEEKKKKEEESEDENAKGKKAKAKIQNQKKKKKNRDVDDEAFEESDDGDEEGREKDYISDSSDSESEPEVEKNNKELKSVAEEPALQKLLTSDEDSDEEKSKHEDDDDSEDEKKKADEAEKSKETEAKSEKAKEKKKDDKKNRMQKFYDAINQKPGTGNASDFSSDSEDSEVDPKNKKKKVKIEKSSSRAGTPVEAKRKIDAITNSSDNSNSPQSTPAKKLKTESAPISSFNNFSSSRDSIGSTEEAVRRYLMRKPMTTTELLKKIQSKKTGVSRDELVDMMTQILKKINPSKQMVQGKMYLSLKAQ